MQVQVQYRPSFAQALIHLAEGEAVRAESGAMVGMTPNVQLDAKMQGGLLSSLGRSLLAGESLFQSTYTAHGGPGELLLAPSLPGDVMVVELSQRQMFIQQGSWLASSTSIELSTKFSGFTQMIAGEGAFGVLAQGTGTLILSSFGAIHKVVLAPGEGYIVDAGHIVAFDAGIRFQMQRAARGLVSSLTSGEGLVCQYTGPGEVYLQTRNLSNFAGTLASMIKTASS